MVGRDEQIGRTFVVLLLASRVLKEKRECGREIEAIAHDVRERRERERCCMM